MVVVVVVVAAAAVAVVMTTMIGGPFFYLWHIMWKKHAFMESLRRNVAIYRATSRGLVLERVSLLTWYKKYASSHFYVGFELIFGIWAYHFFSYKAVGSELYGAKLYFGF